MEIHRSLGAGTGCHSLWKICTNEMKNSVKICHKSSLQQITCNHSTAGTIRVWVEQPWLVTVESITLNLMMMHVLLWDETWVNFYLARDNAKPNKVLKCWKNVQPYSEYTVVRRNEIQPNFKHIISIPRISFHTGVLFSQCTITWIGLNCSTMAHVPILRYIQCPLNRGIQYKVNCP